MTGFPNAETRSPPGLAVVVGGRTYARKAILEGLIGRTLGEGIPELLSIAAVARIVGCDHRTAAKLIKSYRLVETAA